MRNPGAAILGLVFTPACPTLSSIGSIASLLMSVMKQLYDLSAGAVHELLGMNSGLPVSSVGKISTEQLDMLEDGGKVPLQYKPGVQSMWGFKPQSIHGSTSRSFDISQRF